MTNVKTRFILFAVAVATVAGGASAQVKPYALAGSDTLEVVMKDTIKRLDGTLTYGTAVAMPGWTSSIAYLGGGSGTAENAVVADKQSIGAMSRNLTGAPGDAKNIVGLAAAVCMDPFTSLATKTACTLGTAGDTGCATTFGAGSTCVNAALYCSGSAVICTAATAATDCGSATACTGVLPTKRFAPNSYINVVGLDAAVLVEYSATTQIKDLKKSNFVATYGDVPDTTNKLIPNLWGTCSGTPAKRCAKNGVDATGANAGCPTAAETCVADANTTYNNAFEVLISGIDGSGTTLACSHPARLKAIADFSKAQGNKQVQHFYRRDDNSGTTDTFKDKVGVGNFCNGRARGVLSSQRYCVTSAGKITNTRCTQTALTNPPTSPSCGATDTCPQVFGYQSPETGAPTGLVSFNVANQDIDPIRFPCPDQKPGTLQTNCTNVWTSQLCTATDNPHDPVTGALSCDPTLAYDGNAAVGPLNGCPCTQGFVVALAEGDNTTTLYDVTRTIGARVASDTGSSLGYAGRESIRSGYASDAPTIGFSPQNDGHIRNDDYVLARRLFLAQAPNNADSVSLATGNETAIGGAGKLAQEALLANFMTADSTTALVGASGACNIQDIVAKAGFIGCLANCKSIPAVPNICAKTFPGAPSFPGQLVPGQGVNGGPWWDYGPATNFNAAVSNCAATSAIGAPVTGFVTVAASTGVCSTGFTTRPAGYACSTSRECQTGLTCGDNGQLLGILVCQ